MILVLGRQDPLHHHLVGAPIIDAEQGCSHQQPGPGHVGIVGRADQRQFGGIDRAHHMVPAAGMGEAAERDGDRGDDQQDGLDHFGIEHRAQTTRKGVDPRRQGLEDHHLPARHVGQHDAEQQHAAIERGGAVQRDVEEQGDGREIGAREAVEAALEEFRQGVDPRPQQEGDEEDAEEHQDDGAHPFVIIGRDTDAVGGAGQSDQGGRGDVGGEQRQPDHRPGGAARG